MFSSPYTVLNRVPGFEARGGAALIGTLAAASVLLLSIPTATARVWYVDKDNELGLEDGESWFTAFTAVQPAIEAAYGVYTTQNERQELWVAEGIYDEVRVSLVDADERDGTSEMVDTGSIVMREGVDLYGGFAGTEAAREQRDWKTHFTVLDGSRTRGDKAALHVLLGANEVALDGFIVVGGDANEGAWLATGIGGGLYNNATAFAINHCKFGENKAYYGGGAIANRPEGGVVVTDCTFEDNAGAISSYGTAQISRCNFASNSPGAIGATGTVTLEGCSFRGNNTPTGSGGAAAFWQALVMIRDCSFFDNSAVTAGAVLFSNGTGGEVINCLFSQNTAERSGAVGVGTIRCDDDGNCGGPAIVFTNCTFAANVATGELGGGAARSPKVAMFRNCIFWDNVPDQITDPNPPLDEQFRLRVEYSLVEGGWEGIGNLDADPLFIDSSNGDLRLRAGSPAIDAGTLDGAPEVDIRGVARPQGAGVDMGAYEY
ncbi:MAG: right-handed parallel beta-helix repeat-containing protein, partial [Candidatus Hydrogenedentes bacterium]|nr:right-handed parallel beta-helix repeat-containing protein [Candidatus Hydrogenedentota bacterium]